MKLFDYHKLRIEEEASWDRAELEREAGTAFITTAEPLIPAFEHKWTPDRLIHLTRKAWFDPCLQLCNIYRNATAPQRTWLRSRMDPKSSGKIRVFGSEAAVFGAREHSPELARASLIADAIADLAFTDIREVLMSLSLLVHCAGLSGANVPDLLREVAALSGAAMRVLYGEWADRYPNVQPIGSMGLRQVDTEEGVGFR